MRKRYLTAIMVVLILVGVGLYMVSRPSLPLGNPNEPQNQDNGTSNTSSSLKFPGANQTTNESSGGTAGNTSGGGGGGGGSTNKTPTIKNTLSIVSDFTDLSFLVIYYSDGVLQNVTDSPPASVNIDTNTTTCIALASGYEGTYWTVDGETHSMSPCGGYDNGCTIIMDKDHEVRLKQYS